MVKCFKFRYVSCEYEKWFQFLKFFISKFFITKFTAQREASKNEDDYAESNSADSKSFEEELKGKLNWFFFVFWFLNLIILF